METRRRDFLKLGFAARQRKRNRKKAEAVGAYQEFLGYFENSMARLPQTAEARAALKRLM